MNTANYSIRDYKFLIFSALAICIFFLQAHSAPASENRPNAVVLSLNTVSTPEITEQILLHKLRNKLSKSYNLKLQPAFEKALNKLTQSANSSTCQQLKCILRILNSFPEISLFLLKIPQNGKRLSLVMIGYNKKWHVRHEVCEQCALTQQEILNGLVLSLDSYAFPPTELLPQKPKSLLKSASQKQSLKPTVTRQKGESAVTKNIPAPKISKTKIEPPRQTLTAMEQLKFKFAQRRYNRLIGSKIKKDLMFFRQKKLKQSLKNLKTRLRLQIDQFGKVIERRLLETSGSHKFDKIILDSVDLLKLPPPTALLIRNPPYVVTILIQP
ncbi:MAG: hypothetical protein H8E38_04300 [SAR324 cluster bacterium]|nr:hypothetical protein [SAR324 cluster bacterium]